MTRNSVRIEDASVIGFLLTCVSTTVMNDAKRVVTLIGHDDRITTQIMTPFDCWNVLIKLVACETVIRIETGKTWGHTKLTKLIGFIRVFSETTERTFCIKL